MIEIRNKNASETTIINNKIIWDIYLKKQIKFLLIVYSIGIAFLVYGITEIDNPAIRSIKVTKSQGKINEIANYYDFHFSTSLGFVVLIMATISLINYFKQKKAFFKKIEKISENLLKTNNEVLIKIDDEFVKYYSPKLVMEIKWELISNYSMDNNRIFLYIDEFVQSTIIIDRKVISLEEYNYLLDLLNKKIRK
ncbi:MAG: hypothetical protein ACH34V_07885 [Flavobacterium sp.]|uniref:hypothetical protein n=1 Tax=Flavobacterium sp. TaxID=239 RepID=UPI003797DC14